MVPRIFQRQSSTAQFEEVPAMGRLRLLLLVDKIELRLYVVGDVFDLGHKIKGTCSGVFMSVENLSSVLFWLWRFSKIQLQLRYGCRNITILNC